MPDYRRYRIAGGCDFFTVNLLEQRSTDQRVHSIEILRDVVRQVRRTRPFDIDGWVVLPDHMHCIWTLQPGDDDFATHWRLIKTRFPRRVERITAVRQRRGERGIGQRRYWEHAIRNEIGMLGFASSAQPTRARSSMKLPSREI